MPPGFHLGLRRGLRESIPANKGLHSLGGPYCMHRKQLGDNPRQVTGDGRKTSRCLSRERPSWVEVLRGGFAVQLHLAAPCVLLVSVHSRVASHVCCWCPGTLTWLLQHQMTNSKSDLEATGRYAQRTIA